LLELTVDRSVGLPLHVALNWKGFDMIFDHRTYTCKPGTIKAHVELYRTKGLVPQSRHLGPPVLWATTEVGDVNSYVHIWAYKDLADRTAKRAALWVDPEWLAYVKASGELGALVSQTNTILTAASFSKLPGA
jgi:NIPSNAP